MVKIIKYIEIIAWLMSVYDFYARVVKDCKRTSERSEQVSLAIFHNKCIMKIAQTNQPSNQVSYFLWHFNFFRGSTKNSRQTRKWRFHLEGSLIIVHHNLVPRVCLFAGYVVAWLWGNRIEIWLAAAIINVADTLMRVFCENYAGTYAKRELSMFIRFGMRNQTI
jgi:hypothetical protein